MKKLKGERKQDKYGRWYIQTDSGKFYETICTTKIVGEGFHTHGGDKHGRRDD